MNWYRMLKLAYPWGRMNCINCNKVFINDFGSYGRAQSKPTQSIQGNPFKDMEQKQYDPPIPTTDPDFGTQYEIKQEQTENGDEIVQCPHCKAFMEIHYEMNPAQMGTDMFSQAVVTDAELVDSNMVDNYEEAGMPVTVGTPDTEVAA